MSFNETIFGKYPSDWKLSNLGDLISIITDYHANGSYKKLKENVELKDDEDYAIMIRTTNFEQDNFNPSNFKYISKDAYEFLTKTKVFENDLLMNKIANAGSVYKMPKVNKPVSLAMNLFLIRADEEKLDKVYMYYFLKNYEKYVKTYAEGSVTKTITKENVRKLKIAYPSQIEQKAICNILSNIENKIQVNNKINQKLEEMAQAIFKQWFIDFDFPNEEGKPYKSSGGEMVESELGMIPKGWEVFTLEDLFIFKKGKKPKEIVEVMEDDEYLKYLTIDVLNRNSDLYATGANLVECNENDTLMVMDGASSGSIYTGMHGIVGSTLAKLEVKDERIKTFIFQYLKFRETDIKSHLTGSAIPHADKKYINLQKVALPIDIKYLESLSKIMQLNMTKIRTIDNENSKLKITRDTLLPKLMSGEIRVLENN